MLLHMIRSRAGWLTFASMLALPLVILPAQAIDSATSSPTNAMAQASPLSVGDYRRLLREYQEARGAFEQEAAAYWTAIADKRRGRNAKRREHIPIALDDYVLAQPPSYTGPKRPINPEPEEPEAKPPRPRKPSSRNPLAPQKPPQRVT